MSVAAAVVWHDVECGSYTEDLALWRELAAEAGGPVLDVGAGTGRVALDLASHGIDVTALDSEAALLDALAERATAASLDVPTIVADARDFAIGDRRFALIMVPMQTLQLLPDADGRGAFFRAARASLADGGRVAIALADALDSYEGEVDGLPEPDTATVDGITYTSLPLAVVDEGEHAAIHRLRQTSAGSESHDVIRLSRVAPAEVAEEAEAYGLVAETARRIPQTDVYVGSTVVILRAR
ncbi:MAG TPA: class I SAM-dependent methyltransferase [Baekduia sp.]|uniref:class I SAM-dependent methyltransferase n=1 Tax=Baekduia sp. TaxID=2600305 RepID=UPI002D7789BD|nr:class I SAM-dependent methyltransferase [Baekduia sp.]HET6509288.1 class I SAM-dependent methyltransferase [Baekduia sp.]